MIAAVALIGFGIGLGLVFAAAAGLGRPAPVVINDNRTLVLEDRRTVVLVAAAPEMAADPPMRDFGETPMLARDARAAIRAYRDRTLPEPARKKELTC